MANAFNSVDWTLLRDKIAHLTIPDYLKNIIYSFLEDRTVSMGSTSRSYSKGVPQGSSLGPLLWNIFVNDLLNNNLGEDICLQAFADDIIIMFSAPATYQFTQMCSGPLSTINDWIHNNKLTINHSKSVFTILANRRPQLEFPPRTNNRQSTQIMHKLTRITRVTWGLNPIIKKEIYKRVIEKILTYGFELWYNDSARQNIKLCKLQRIGLLSITKSYRTVSSDALYILAGIPPIHITLQNRIKLYHLCYLKQDVSIQGIAYSPMEVESIPTIDPPWNRFRITWNIYNNDVRCVTIFTDGSKLDNPTGCALVVFIDGHEAEHMLCSSIYSFTVV
ncbi:hypothetical protein CDAR_318802 [Caerostris darwini]|nr:hypothetical protein CDAR_318802 [Caerostris darwini]